MDFEGRFKGEEYFTCGKFNCLMRKAVCFKRQAMDHTFYDFFPQLNQIVYSLKECSKCEQGKRLAAEAGQTIRVKRTVITKKTRRGRTRNFIREFPELGFNTERDLFESLRKTHTLEEIAEILATCVTTVKSRLKSYEISMPAAAVAKAMAGQAATEKTI